VLSSKVGISVIACYSSIELGMALGVAGGPVGVVAGGIVGGLFGGIVSNLCGRKIDDIT
jgi:ABC-type microcin C transport system permease subunit YejE